MDTQVKVLYIAGSGRSGSTILDMTLGQVDGFVSTGELVSVFRKHGWCSCGKFIRSECEVWQRIFTEAFGSPTEIADACEFMNHAIPRHTRLQYLPYALLPNGTTRLRLHINDYLDLLARLYGAIHRVSGCQIVVDSSKTPSYGYLLSTIPDIDLYVVHLVRDARAVAYSWQRVKSVPHPKTPWKLKYRGPVLSSWMWIRSNLFTEIFWPHKNPKTLSVRYEDFVKNPQDTVQAILDLTDQHVERLPFVQEHEIAFEPVHTVAGNPVRHQRKSSITLKLDEEWSTQLSRKDRRIVTLLTWPLLLRYGYL